MPDPIPTATDPKFTTPTVVADTDASTESTPVDPTGTSGFLSLGDPLTLSSLGRDTGADPLSSLSTLLALEEPTGSEDTDPLAETGAEDSPPSVSPELLEILADRGRLLSYINDEKTPTTDLLSLTQELIKNGDTDALLAVVGQIGIRLAKMEKQFSFIDAQCSNKEIKFAREQNQVTQEKVNAKKAEARRLQNIMKGIMWAVAILGALIAIIALVSAIFTGGASILGLIGAIVGVVASIASITVMAVREAGVKVPDWVDYLIMGIGLGGALMSIGPAIMRAVASVVKKCAEVIISKVSTRVAAAIVQKMSSYLVKQAAKVTESVLKTVCTKLIALGTAAQGMLQIANGVVGIFKGCAEAELITQQTMSKFYKGKLDQLQMILDWIVQALDQANENLKKICDLLSGHFKNEADVLASTQQNLA